MNQILIYLIKVKLILPRNPLVSIRDIFAEVNEQRIDYSSSRHLPPALNLENTKKSRNKI